MGTFRDGVERCGIKIRADKNMQNKKGNGIEEILNAVFGEMDFENTGYVTVHSFSSMMMSQDKNNSNNTYHSYLDSNPIAIPNYNISDYQNYANYYLHDDDKQQFLNNKKRQKTQKKKNTKTS